MRSSEAALQQRVGTPLLDAVADLLDTSLTTLTDDEIVALLPEPHG